MPPIEVISGPPIKMSDLDDPCSPLLEKSAVLEILEATIQKIGRELGWHCQEITFTRFMDDDHGICIGLAELTLTANGAIIDCKPNATKEGADELVE